MKTIVTLVFCLFSVTFFYGQYSWTEGTLVLKNGESLIGEIELPVPSRDLIRVRGKEKVKYRKNRKSKTTKFEEDQVDHIIFRNEKGETSKFEYVPVSKKKKELFQVVSSGRVTLYARKIATSAPVSTAPGTGMAGGAHSAPVYLYSFTNFNEFYVLRKNEEAATPLITPGWSSFRKKAMKYFSDCPAVVAKLDDKVYKREDIKDVVEEYNNCL